MYNKAKAAPGSGMGMIPEGVRRALVSLLAVCWCSETAHPLLLVYTIDKRFPEAALEGWRAVVSPYAHGLPDNATTLTLAEIRERFAGTWF